MVATPADIADTIPVLFTMATEEFEDTHGEIKACVPEPDNCDIVLTQADKVPVTSGKAFTVKTVVT